MSGVLNLEKDSAKRDRRLMAQLLLQAGAKNAERKSLCCPFHEDKHPSATVTQAPSGFWYFNCFVCGISDDVWALKARISGVDVGTILKESNPYTPPKHQSTPPAAKVEHFETIDQLISAYRNRNPKNIIQEINAYSDVEIGDAKFYTLRILPFGETRKKYLQVSKNGDGWQYSGLTGSTPLFNRPRIKSSDRILIVEGEKCVREVTKLGPEKFVATTSPGGAQNGSKADWSPLAGKACFIWRDNDGPGKQYESDVIAELTKLDPPAYIYRVRVEELGLEEKQDVADYLNDPAMSNAEKVAALELILFDAEPIGVTSALEQKFNKIMAGEFRAIPFPQKKKISDLSKAVMPGCLTTICGEPGAGKSFLITEDFWRWCVQHNEKVKLLMLEDDAAFHQNRALAQMSGVSDLLDPDFVLENPELSRQLFAQYREPLELFGRNLETATGQMTLAEIAAWVTKHAENGVRIIGVDPITAAKVSDKPWADDQAFLFSVKRVLEETGASLILTTHPRLGQVGKPSLSGMAGGASYPRFSQSVFWIKNFDAEQETKVWNGYLYETVKHKQILQIRKARNGKGQGKNFAVNLNFQNLCFDELGEIRAD